MRGRVKKDLLNELSTEELVDELKDREGVNAVAVGPEDRVKANIEGPVILLEVID
ncbi:MAG: hypothetical protein AWU54_2253 [Candidatus Frackibacter sp. T328-2]|nr:MAG: hypothetical protein AWU54_2253 [Candidatus Frackibacter sp. T328-2]